MIQNLTVFLPLYIMIKKLRGGYMWKKRNKNEKTSENKKIRIVHLFLNRFTYIGWALILVSIIINLKRNNLASHISDFHISLICDMLSTIGIALFIGAIFDLAKNSEEFIESISKILSNIVVSKSFLNTLSENDKRQALELILQPSGDQLQQYSNINHYFQKKIDESVAMFDTNFKSHLSLFVTVYKEDLKVKARSKLQYRIYKINNEYKPIQTWFEQEGSTFLSTKIICNSKTFVIENENIKKVDSDGENLTRIPYEKTYFDIPKEYQDAPYVTVQYDVVEPGFDHWINYIWTSLTPYDGLNFSLTCEGNLTIQQHYLFDNGRGYTVDLDDDKKHISILSTEWLNSFTGVSIIVGESQAGSPKPSQDSNLQ